MTRVVIVEETRVCKCSQSQTDAESADRLVVFRAEGAARSWWEGEVGGERQLYRSGVDYVRRLLGRCTMAYVDDTYKNNTYLLYTKYNILLLECFATPFFIHSVAYDKHNPVCDMFM